jgi:phage/plasmid-like protein (TIGR03299 family)
MAHDLNFNESTGNYNFFSVKEKPWHGLGQILDGYPAASEAIKLAGLDYEVVKTPLFIHSGSLRMEDSVIDNTNREIIVPDFFATKRTDTDAPLGVVGKDYQIVQNRDAFSFFDSIVEGDGILYETAGALGKNGERIFITAKLPDYIRVGKDDLIERYLFLTNSHDGSGSITAAFTPIRVVCRNTLNAAMRNLSNVVRIRHTANAKLRLEQAHKVMGMTCRFSNEIEPVFNQWAKVRITDTELKKLIELAMAPNREVLGKLKDSRVQELSSHYTNMVESVYEYALGSPTQNMETTAGTVFGCYNAITGYFQNVRSYKDEEAKVKSVLLGGTAQLRGQTAFNLCEGFTRYGADVFNMN